MIKGNKGEWSELYVLVTLLAEGKLHQSDVNLEKDHKNIYEVIKAFKAERDYSLEFERNGEVTINKVTGEQKTVVTRFTFDELKAVSTILYEGIKSGKGRSFAIIEAEEFIQDAYIQKLKADPSVKADIQLRIYDHRLAKETDLGFSIKSLIGGDSTLFNTGVGNNFIFSTDQKLSETVSSFNQRTYKAPGNLSKLTVRLNELEKESIVLDYETIQSNQLWRNLKMIDGDLPEILAWALYYRWSSRKSKLNEVAEILEDKDPMNFYNGQKSTQKFYEYKIKRFLTEAAMGMTSETPWNGEYDSFGGVIIAKKDGDILCFHVYDFNLFRNYLINNTFFEQPSTGEDSNNPGNPKSTGKKYHYGWLYEENNRLKYKINLQIRFTK